MQRPLLAITMGDPAGVGPETVVGAWHEPAVHEAARLVVTGNVEVMRRAARMFGRGIGVVEVAAPEEVASSPTALPCLACGPAAAADAKPGTIDLDAGHAAYEAIVLAAELSLTGRADGIVTAPINKAALWQAGHHYPGHTNLLAELCKADDVAMMLYLPAAQPTFRAGGLGVVHVTLHQALRDVFDRITHDRVVASIRLLDRAMRRLAEGSDSAPTPRIGVCALNPHAGEDGLFGDEERQIIRPAVEQCAAEGFDVEGPHPADTLLYRASAGEFDGVVAMYHDQGHIAVKLLGMHRAVNVTLGLPIVRTSVAHGTAFDLAWQGRAETTGMTSAIQVAAHLARVRARQIGTELHATT